MTFLPKIQPRAVLELLHYQGCTCPILPSCFWPLATARPATKPVRMLFMCFSTMKNHCKSISTTSYLSSPSLFARRRTTDGLLGPGLLGLPVIASRCLAKSKKGKGKKTQSPKVSLSMDLADGVIDLQDLVDKMENICKKYRDTLVKRVSTSIKAGMFDDILVETASGRTKLFNIASVKLDEKFIIITVINTFPNACKKIQEGIKVAGYDLSSQIIDDTIRVQIPLVTKEYKNQLKRIAKGFSDQSKVQIRKVRQEGMMDLRKNQDLVSKDESRLLEKQIQALHDNAIARIEDIMDAKNKELDN